MSTTLSASDNLLLFLADLSIRAHPNPDVVTELHRMRADVAGEYTPKRDIEMDIAQGKPDVRSVNEPKFNVSYEAEPSQKPTPVAVQDPAAEMHLKADTPVPDGKSKDLPKAPTPEDLNKAPEAQPVKP